MNSRSSGSVTIKIHTNDFAKFGNNAFLYSEKAGFLLKQGAVNTYSLKKRYFALYASLLYYFETDEPDTCIGMTFVESCTITIPRVGSESTSFDHIEYTFTPCRDGIMFKEFGNEEFFPFVVTTVGGKKCPLFAPSAQERDNWIDALLTGQRLTLNRRLEELSQQSKSHESVRQEAGLNARRATLARTSLVKEIDNLSKENKELKQQIERMESDFKAAMSRLEESDAERMTLLTARGVIPRASSLWAQPYVPPTASPRSSTVDRSETSSSNANSRNVSPHRVMKRIDRTNDGSPQKDAGSSSSILYKQNDHFAQLSSSLVLRMWVGTWNMGATGLPSLLPTSHVDHSSFLQPFVVPGYDVYAIGVQECVGDSFMLAMRETVASHNVYQIDLQQSLESDGSVHFFAPGNVATSDIPGRFTSNTSSDPARLNGRGDGSLISTKFTGMAVFLQEQFENEVTVLAVTQLAFSNVTCKGGVAVALSFAGRSIVFVSCHLEAHHNKVEVRREQYRMLVTQLGSSLAEEGFHLNEQFHHIIWVGDMNYRLCSVKDDNHDSYSPMPSDVAQKMLEQSQNRTLFDKHDQFNLEKRRREIFYGFREANPFPNFYPTYKKIENRPPMDLNDAGWVKNTYRLKYKEPFYKGGSVKERTPGFCDRILYHSTADLAESLVPETVVVNLDVTHQPTMGRGFDHKSATTGSSDTYVQRDSTDSRYSLDVDYSKLTKVVDNYQSVLEGIPFTLSDHSPVFGTFLLRIDNYTEHVKRHKAYLKWRNSQEVANREIASTLFSDESMFDLDECAELVSSHATLSENSIPRPLRRLSHEATPPWRYTNIITLSDVTLICGSTEFYPCGARLLFPLPFEVPQGEEFATLATDNSDTATRISHGGVDLFQNYPKKIKSTTAGWSSIPSDTKSCVSLKFCQSYDAQVLGEGLVNATATGERKPEDSIYDLAKPVDPLSVSWAHPTIPLDDLHVALRVAVPAAAVLSSPVKHQPTGPKKSSSGDRDLEGAVNTMEKRDDTDYMIGHCSLGLNRLCQTAAAAALSHENKEHNRSSDLKGAGGTAHTNLSEVAPTTVSVASILVRNGRPLYNIDHHSMQREVVTLCCKLTLSSAST